MLKKLIERSDHEGRVWSTEICSKGEGESLSIFTCGADSTIRVYSLEGSSLKQEEALPKSHTRSVRALAVDKTGTLLAAAGFDKKVSVYSLSGDPIEEVASFESHENEIKDLAFHHSADLLATCGRDKSIWVWEYDEMFEFSLVCVVNAHGQDVKCVSWVPTQDWMLSGSYDNTIKLWKRDPEAEDETEYFCFQTLTAHRDTVWTLAVDLEGQTFFSAGNDGLIIRWDFDISSKEFRLTHKIETGFEEPIYSLAWDSSRNLLFAATGENSIALFTSKADGPIEKKWVQEQAHQSDVNKIKWDPEHQILVSVGDDAKTILWTLNQNFEQKEETQD